MARFVKLTRLRGDGEFVLNLDTVEYMVPIPNNAGTTLFTVTHHTKYEVRESMDDILSMLDDVGMVLTVTKTTPPVMETINKEDKVCCG